MALIFVKSHMNFFELRTSRDLYKKIKDDLLILESSHQDTKAAFNFFVTIEHLPDWLGKRNLVKDNCILRVISHIANGAKHFHLKDMRHKSVINTEKSRYIEEGYIKDGYFEEPLLIYLSPEEANKLGSPTIDALTLAKRAVEFWKPYVEAT